MEIRLRKKSKVNYTNKLNGCDTSAPPKFFSMVRDLNGTQISIQNAEKWYAQFNYLITLFAACIGGLALLWMILFSRSEPSFNAVVISIGIFSWILTFGFLIYDFLFQIHGCLIIQIKKPYFVFQKKLFYWKRKQSFETKSIEEFEVVQTRIGAFRSDGFQLRMHYKGALKIILERKNEKEIQELRQIIQTATFGKRE